MKLNFLGGYMSSIVSNIKIHFRKRLPKGLFYLIAKSYQYSKWAVEVMVSFGGGNKDRVFGCQCRTGL